MCVERPGSTFSCALVWLPRSFLFLFLPYALFRNRHLPRLDSPVNRGIGGGCSNPQSSRSRVPAPKDSNSSAARSHSSYTDDNAQSCPESSVDKVLDFVLQNFLDNTVI